MGQNSEWMRKAIRIGEKGRLDAPPNPWVGCVIVKNNQLLGSGFHAAYGEPHAEIFALKEAGSKAKKSSVYVTLEPCAHHGKTPPCIDALIHAEVSEVFIGVEDPDPKVTGKGVEFLRKAGIKVTTGLCEKEVKKSLTPYLHHRLTGQPYVILKVASSVDGRLAAKDGSSQWISCSEARFDTHQLRAESQAILVGAGTVIKDHPKLSVRDIPQVPKNTPLKVVLDRQKKLGSRNLDYDITFTDMNLKDVLIELGSKGVLQLLVEGGSGVASSFINASLVNELVIYTGPKILGSEGVPLFQNIGITTLSEATPLKLKSSVLFGDTVKSTYSLIKVPTSSP